MLSYNLLYGELDESLTRFYTSILIADDGDRPALSVIWGPQLRHLYSSFVAAHSSSLEKLCAFDAGRERAPPTHTATSRIIGLRYK